MLDQTDVFSYTILAVCRKLTLQTANAVAVSILGGLYGYAQKRNNGG